MNKREIDVVRRIVGSRRGCRFRQCRLCRQARRRAGARQADRRHRQHQPAWHFRDEAGNLAGFDIDIAKIVAKGLFDDPEKVEFVIQASDARVPNVVTDKVDITCQFMTVTAARAQLVNFTIPYYREGVGLLLDQGRQVQVA